MKKLSKKRLAAIVAAIGGLVIILLPVFGVPVGPAVRAFITAAPAIIQALPMSDESDESDTSDTSDGSDHTTSPCNHDPEEGPTPIYRCNDDDTAAQERSREHTRAHADAGENTQTPRTFVRGSDGEGE
jgi:hypothetical protein